MTSRNTAACMQALPPTGADGAPALEAAALGPWYHNLHLPDGVQTAPQHPLGDFPRMLWESLSPHLPADLSGRTVLDIGCNAGFYSIELARRGAQVTALDLDPHFLRQARWATRLCGVADRVALYHGHVHDLARWRQRFDIVLFLGVFYHLRYPVLALDIVTQLTGDLLVFQTLSMPGDEVEATPADLPLTDRDAFQRPGWPKLAFIEHAYAGDATNWWAPNRAACEAILRSAGLAIDVQPAPELYVCRRASGDVEPPPELAAATGTSATGISPFSEMPAPELRAS